MGVNNDFKNDWMHGFAQSDVAPQLEAGTKVLIYAGDVDFVCNWIGNKHWTVALNWSGGAGFRKALDQEWGADASGKPGGKVRCYRNFCFLQVYQAGHMVPMDQPEVALAMMEQFTTDGNFISFLR